jgi:hypothetical protein
VYSKKSWNKEYCLIVLGMLYVTINTLSDFLFFRQISISTYFSYFTISPSAAAFSWPLTYIISDAAIVIAKRKIAIFIIVFGTFCDAIFGLVLQWIPVISHDYNSHSDIISKSLSMLGIPIWTLVYTGIDSTIITAVLEIIIFTAIYERIDRFITSAIISITTTLLIRTFLGDYLTLRHESNVISILFSNLAINILVLVFYFSVLKLGIRIVGYKIKYFK